MAKDRTIILRVSADTKSRIETAAQSRGLSVSAFVLGAAVRAAEMAKPIVATAGRGRSGACPTFFRALILTAQEGGAGGGYNTAAYELTRHLADLIEHEGSEDGNAKLAELTGLVKRRDVGGVLDWFERELPRCLALVPERRYPRFVEGVYQRIEDDGRLML